MMTDESVRMDMQGVNCMGKDKPVSNADCTYLKEGTSFLNSQDLHEYVVLPDGIFRNADNSFMTRANGNGMQGVGIDDGDFLLFQKTDQVESGEVGMFVYGSDNQTACRIYKKLHGKTFLLATSSEREPVCVDNDANFRTLGRLLYIVKDVRKNRY